LMKRQAKLALDKASKSCNFMKQISVLDDKVSGLMAKIVHLEECDSFLIGIVESVCEMLQCKVPCSLPLFPFIPLLLANTFCYLRYLPGLCWGDTSGFWVNCGSRESIRGNRQFVVWSPMPSCHCASSRSCSAHWRSGWWLSKIFDDHVFFHAPSQSFVWKLSTATRRF
jgi:hypothetical protein